MTELYFLFPAETTNFITNIYFFSGSVFLVVPTLNSTPIVVSFENTFE